MPSWNVHFDLHVDEASAEIAGLIASARADARTISGIPLPPGVQEQLHRLNILRAVHGTTALEGVAMTEEQVAQAIAAAEGGVPPLGPSDREVREVQNAHNLMRYVERILRDDPRRPLTEALIREFHAILTDGIDYPNNDPGRYRAAGVAAGDYHAPDHDRVPALMADFVRWLNEGAGRSLDPIVRAIAAHFLLVSIHPFGDGNGRTSRAVECFFLYQAGVNVRGFYSLANYYYEHRQEYGDMLMHVRFRSDPDLTPFVRFALYGLSENLGKVHAEVIAQVRIIAFKDYARETIAGTGSLGRPSGDRQMRFLLGLAGLEDKMLSVNDLRGGRHPLASVYRGVGAKTLTRDLNSLQEMELIVIEDGWARANLEAMDRFTPSL